MTSSPGASEQWPADWGRRCLRERKDIGSFYSSETAATKRDPRFVLRSGADIAGGENQLE